MIFYKWILQRDSLMDPSRVLRTAPPLKGDWRLWFEQLHLDLFTTPPHSTHGKEKIVPMRGWTQMDEKLPQGFCECHVGPQFHVK